MDDETSKLLNLESFVKNILEQKLKMIANTVYGNTRFYEYRTHSISTQLKQATKLNE